MPSTTLPNASAFTGAAVTEGAFKTAITDLRTMIDEVLGNNSTGTPGAKVGFVMLGKAYINDSANATMQIGLTINQGASDDEILCLKSDDVDHGMTGFTETDTFGRITKESGLGGGLSVQGISENVVGLSLIGTHTNDDSGKSTAAEGGVKIFSSLKSGTGDGGHGANVNLLVVRDYATTRFILDSDGDSHQDVGTAWTNFDEHHDVALLHALSAHLSRPGDPIKREFRSFLKLRRKDLERLKLVKFNHDGHHFVNMSKLTMLHTGAIRQLSAHEAEREAQLREQRREIARLSTLAQRLAGRVHSIEHRGAA